MPESNLLVLDTNKWLKVVEEVEDSRSAESWKKYLKESSFAVILPNLVLKEIIELLTKEGDNIIWKNREKTLLRLMNTRKVFCFEHAKIGKDMKDYYSMASSIIRRHGINHLLKAHGLYTIIRGNAFYALHKKDLGILISLKELGRPYYFITHDNGLLKALQVTEVRRALVQEGLCFVLLHETQKAKGRKVTRVKVLQDYI